MGLDVFLCKSEWIAVKIYKYNLMVNRLNKESNFSVFYGEKVFAYLRPATLSNYFGMTNLPRCYVDLNVASNGHRRNLNKNMMVDDIWKRKNEIAKKLELPDDIENIISDKIQKIEYACLKHDHFLGYWNGKFNASLMKVVGKDLYDAFPDARNFNYTVYIAPDWIKSRAIFIDIVRQFILNGDNYPIFGFANDNEMKKIEFLRTLDLNIDSELGKKLIANLTDDGTKIGRLLDDCMDNLINVIETIDYVLQQPDQEKYILKWLP